MSIGAAIAFRNHVVNHPEIENETRNEYLKRGSVDNTIVGRQHGDDFTADEADIVWNDVALAGEELSDFELEMISAGGRYPCCTDDKRFAADANMRAMGRGGNDT